MFKNATRGKKLALTILAVVLLTAGATALLWEFVLSPRAAFRHFVMHPIPRSVQNIQVDHCQMTSLEEELYDGRKARAAVLRFDINGTDVLKIVERRGLHPCQKIGCVNGMVSYVRIQEDRFVTDDGRVFITRGPVERFILLYDEDANRFAPGWFDLDKWADSDAYWAGEDDPAEGWEDASVLIYNEQLGSAFLVKWETSGF